MLDEDNQGPKTRLNKLQATAFSVFVQNAMTIGDFTITPGLRVENYSQKKSGKVDSDDKFSTYETPILPGISLLYDGFAQTQVYAGVHRGYAPANARNADPLSANDAALSPETGINSQIGVRSSAVKGLDLDVAVFHNMLEDTLIRSNILDDFGDQIFVNEAEALSYGVDIGAQFNTAAYTGSPYNWFARLAWNYTRAEFTDGPLDGNRLPDIPKHAGSLSLGVEHRKGWNVSATLSHFGDFFGNRQNTFELGDGQGNVPSRTLLSARASYRFKGTPATVWIQGRNLTDKLYVVNVADGLRPGAERTVVGGVKLTF